MLKIRIGPKMKKTLWIALCLVLSYYVAKADTNENYVAEDYSGRANSASVAFRSIADRTAGVENGMGEATYSHAKDVGVNLSLGTRYGTEYVTDPYAIKKPTVRLAENAEWTLVLGEGTSFSTNGIVLFNESVEGMGNTTRYVDVVPTSSNRIAKVDLTGISRSVVGYPNTVVSTNGTCRISCDYDDSMPKIGGNDKLVCIVRGLTVHVYDNDLDRIEYDFTNGDIRMKDTVGDVTLGTMRHWMTNYYHKTDYDWSLRTALHDVKTGGHRLVFNDKFWFGIGDTVTATNTLSVYAGGKALMTFSPAFEASSSTGSNLVSRSWREWCENNPNWSITNFQHKAENGVCVNTFWFNECTVTGIWYTVLYCDNINFENATQSGEYRESPIVFRHADSTDAMFYKVVVHPPDEFDDGEEIESETISVHDRISVDTDLYVYNRLLCDRDGYVRFDALERALAKLATEGITVNGTNYTLTATPVQ